MSRLPSHNQPVRTSSKLPINLEDLLRQRTVERDRIEYKAGWNPDPTIRTLCAFANDFENLGGGYIIIGQDCDEDGQPIFPPAGIPDTQLDKIQRELLAYCNQIQPPYFPKLSIEKVDGKNLIVLWAARRPEPAVHGSQGGHGQAPRQSLLHPPLLQHGRGQGRRRSGNCSA